jgi:GNAT superfamily N-acetyltransferase
MAIALRAMSAGDVAEADRVMRMAFGTEFALPDPMQFRGDSGLVDHRFGMYPEGCVVAECDGRIAGFGIASRWGSVGVLGPICVLPQYWNRGIARQLVARSVARIDAWGCTAAGLFTNPASPRHLRLYQEVGFWPRSLTLVMALEAAGGLAPLPCERLSATSRPRTGVLADAVQLCGRAFPGLDLSTEITAVVEHRHGDALLLYDGEQLEAFAVCHYGAGSEGGSQALYVKFAQTLAGSAAEPAFARLLGACLGRARELGVKRVVAGVNTARHRAYRLLLAAGFRSEFHGVRMHRPFMEIYDSDASFALDDWR